MMSTISLLLLYSMWYTLMPCSAFKYESSNPWELTAPHTLCASGVAGTVLGPCPQSVQEMNTYDAIVMDEHGYVDVKITGLRFTSTQRRALREDSDNIRAGVNHNVGIYQFEPSKSESKETNFANFDTSQSVTLSLNASIIQSVNRMMDDDINRSAENTQDEESQEHEKLFVLDKLQSSKIQHTVAQNRRNKDNVNLKSNKVNEERNQTASLDKSKANEENMTINKPNIDKKSSSIDSVAKKYPDKFHIQVYLVCIDVDCRSNSFSSTKNDKEDLISSESYILHSDFLSGKGLCCYEYDEAILNFERNKSDTLEDLKNLMQQCTPMDMRPLVPRTGMNQKLSAPLSITSSSNATSGAETVVSVRFRPVGRGRHMVVISNCAAELDDSDVTRVKPLSAHFEKIEFKFISKFGELPLSMMGIIPFYGLLLTLYAALGWIWFQRSRGMIGCPKPGIRYRSQKPHYGHSTQAKPLLGLQRAIFYLVLLQLGFTFVAFAYYLHLNVTVVDIDILYGGTMAALASFTPFSALVAVIHFITFLSCQAVVMLATDGTWLIQNSIRPDTKKVLYLLGTAWAIYFATNIFLSRKARLTILILLGAIWVTFLVFNIRRSLRHLRLLILGHSDETVMAIGGALVAKRSMYRKMFAAVAIYPAIFIAGITWNAKCHEDTWAWVGYVLVDVYVFIILLHASIAWLPRSLTAMEVMKYMPLENAKSSSINDADLWEEDIIFNIDDLDH